MTLSVVLIHYHTPDLLERSVQALLDDGQKSHLDLLVVDNGSHPEDRALFDRLPIRLLSPKANLGYAGGINLGMAETTSDHVVVMNPDVLVRPGCLRALQDALEDGAAVAGPRFFWDEQHQLLLPPTEPMGRWWEISNVLAERGGFLARRARRRWRRHAQRHWLAEETIPSHDLSGALLALQRKAWTQIGPFDEGYPLYFEETDWLVRLRRNGLGAVYVPRAKAVHLYAQSSVKEGRAAEWFQISCRRFRRKVYGPAFTRFLEGLGRWVERSPKAPTSPATARSKAQVRWLEIAPSAKGYPAAGWRLAEDLTMDPGGWPIPDTVWQRMAPGTYWLRGVAATGQELGEECREKRDDGGQE